MVEYINLEKAALAIIEKEELAKKNKDDNIDDTKFLMEPKIHSHITNCLDEDHPLAHRPICCSVCGYAIHSLTNECIQTWVETGKGNYCLDCFVTSGGRRIKICKVILGDEYGLSVGSKEEEKVDE